MPRRSKRIDWEAIARQNVHPLKVGVLDVLSLDRGRTLSVNELRQELQVPLPKLAYHVSALHEQGTLELVETRQARGALEHFYCLAGAA